MKVLLMGDSWHTISGFGTALRNLATYLQKVGHDVYYMGWQTFGQQMVGSFHEDVLWFKGLPNVGGHKFGEQGLKYWMNRVKPDVILMLSDFWMINWLYRSEIPYPTMMWYPIDGYPITDTIVFALKKIDHRVCISKYGRDMVLEAGIDTDYIPHGVDINIHKLRDRADINDMKRRLRIPPDKLVIGRFDRNQTRKKIPRTLKAFTKLHKDYPETILLLWMDKTDREGWDIPFICKRFGLEEGKDYVFPPPDILANFMYGAPANELATGMGCVDIHCWLTGGEGFGLTGLETMANGAVNVATDYTTPKEIFGDWSCGLPVKVETFETGSAGVDRALADVDHAYEQMKWLIENPDEMRNMSKRGVERAKKHYNYAELVKEFDNLMRTKI